METKSNKTLKQKRTKRKKQLSQKMQNLPIKLVSLRQTYGLSVTKLSKLLDIPVSFIRNWETGDSYPNIIELSNLADVYQINISDILEEKPNVDLTSQHPNANLYFQGKILKSFELEKIRDTLNTVHAKDHEPPIENLQAYYSASTRQYLQNHVDKVKQELNARLDNMQEVATLEHNTTNTLERDIRALQKKLATTTDHEEQINLLNRLQSYIDRLNQQLAPMYQPYPVDLTAIVKMLNNSAQPKIKKQLIKFHEYADKLTNNCSLSQKMETINHMNNILVRMHKYDKSLNIPTINLTKIANSLITSQVVEFDKKIHNIHNLEKRLDRINEEYLADNDYTKAVRSLKSCLTSSIKLVKVQINQANLIQDKTQLILDNMNSLQDKVAPKNLKNAHTRKNNRKNNKLHQLIQEITTELKSDLQSLEQNISK